MSKEIAKRQFEYIRKHVNSRPKLCIVCGSCLGGMTDMVDNTTIIPYSDIPDFPITTVPEHSGNLVFGQLNGISVVMMQGRNHCYEGYSTKTVCLPIRLMRMLGVETILMTNAAGSVNENYKVGDFCIINDHINLASLIGQSPLIGPNDNSEGIRFPPMNKVYSRNLIELFKTIAKEMGEEKRTHEGVYCFQMGPGFETSAEIKMIRSIGADLVGMSTCFEASYASYLGMRVLAVSLVTFECLDSIHNDKSYPDHFEVLETAKRHSQVLMKIFSKFVEKFNE